MFARVARLFRRRPAGPVWLAPGELQDRLDRGELPMIIDVRGPDEFDGPLGHIEGALNIPHRRCDHGGVRDGGQRCFRRR